MERGTGKENPAIRQARVTSQKIINKKKKQTERDEMRIGGVFSSVFVVNTNLRLFSPLVVVVVGVVAVKADFG